MKPVRRIKRNARKESHSDKDKECHYRLISRFNTTMKRMSGLPDCSRRGTREGQERDKIRCPHICSARNKVGRGRDMREKYLDK
jgi:hypothetical protein